ncbi:MAG TPA: hypothetical protein VE861_00340 [Gemmatimonadaceae bacterium]|nr:hypothetical protein [Gemmatimonadaceae bacterium]
MLAALALSPFRTLLAQAKPASRPPARPSAPAPSARGTSAALARAGDAVVTVIAYRDGSSEVSSGSGVRLADGRVVASLRQLRGASRAEVFGVDGDLLANVTTLEQAEVRFDLAVLSRITAPGEGLVLARRSAVIAQKVSVLRGKKGTTRSVLERTVVSVEPDASGRPLLRIGAAITGSAIGSPVVNARSELVGIALGTVTGRDDGDIVIDVSAVRELLARPAVRLALPGRDGSIAVAPATDAKAPAPGTATGEAAARLRTAGIFPERYGRPIDADTVKGWALDLYGCARIEVRRKVYCYLRVTNLATGATFAVSGADLADSTRRRTRSAENLILGESVQRVAGWRKKATVPLKELESARVALEFTAPGRDEQAVHLVVDVTGERQVWFGPFALQRAP